MVLLYRLIFELKIVIMKISSEWNEFTEAMNEEVVKSNQMLEEEDEHGNLARDISKDFRILDRPYCCFSRS